jgi:LPS-assembly protein
MTRHVLVAAWIAAAVLLAVRPASARQAGQSLPGIDSNQQWHFEIVSAGYYRLTGDVQLDIGDMRLHADEAELIEDRDLLILKGNVTLITPTQRISADSATFNIKTKFGSFKHASGNARVHGDDQNPPESSQFGATEPEVLFYGETIEKIGERKYRITDGGFTTCVQPKPRWELTSGTVVLSIDHYAMLKNMVMHVKGVPVIYLPVIYYPINKEDRATGFLMPMYGSSSLRGQTLSNAFFWAISRSQDATIMHDWFSKTGQGMGGEYRYMLSPSSSGDARMYWLNEKSVDSTDASGTTTSIPGRRSFELRGGLQQDLPLRLRARARVDYFSDITVQQTYNTNIYDASRRQRYFGGAVSGNWGTYSLNAAFDQNQYFFSGTDSTTTGSLPRVSFTRGEQPIKGTPLYFGLGTEYASIVRKTESSGSVYDSGLQRIDALPTLRFPFRTWPFFTVNTSLAWRYTWWSESLEADTREQVATPISRNYFDMQARVVGPVFNRIWNTPDNGYAEKYKHTVEPWVNFQRVTSIDNQDLIVQLDQTDYIYGGTTRIMYGLNNRLYAKRKADGGRAREMLSVGIRQTYYSDERASAVDPNYATSFSGAQLQKLSPVSLAARFSPTDEMSGTFRTEYNTYVNAFLTLGAVGTYTFKETLTTSAGWSQRRYVPGLSGYDDPAYTNHYINGDATLRFNQNRYGAGVSFNYDIKNGSMLQSRFVGYYNAQCCGISMEYQTFNFGGIDYSYGYRPPVTQDHRFSIAITLAGLGSFSPMAGQMSNTATYR